jgi:hypothetical protein
VFRRFLRFKLKANFINNYGSYPFAETILESQYNRENSNYLADIWLSISKGEESNCLLLFTEGNSVYYLALCPTDKPRGQFLRFKSYRRIGFRKFALKPDYNI